jgi:hypothetical protein
MAIPPAVSDDETSAPQMARVAALIVAFQRTLKAFRLYTEDHPTLRSAVAEFHRELGRILETETELVFRVAQGRITFRGTTVYESLDRDEGFAFRLFIHGVREIAFCRGVPATEVFDLCLVLHRTLRTRTPVDDLLSLLWEKDFTSINFIVLEDFLEDADRSEFDRFLTEGRTSEEPATSLRSTVKPMLDRLMAQAASADGRFATLFHVSESERRRVDDLVLEEKNRDLFRELAGLALPLAEHSPGPEAAEILGILTRSVMALLSEGGFRAAAGLAREIAGFLAQCCSAGTRTAVAEALATIDPGQLIATVNPYLGRVRPEDLDRLAEVIAMLGPRSAEAVETLLQDPATRIAGFELLRRGGGGSTPVLLARLCDPGIPTDILLRILPSLGSHPGPELLSALRVLIRHPEMDVRREAFRLLRRVGTEDTFPFIREALLSADQDTRLLAIGTLEGLPPASYRDALLRIVEAADFPSRDYFEKRGILLALGRAKDRTSEDFLLRAVRRRTILRRQASAEIRACAVTALAIRRSAKGLEEIHRAMSDPSPMVRQAAATALRADPDPA